jgi:hypothetical protein
MPLRLVAILAACLLIAAEYEQKQGAASLRLEGVRAENGAATAQLSDELTLTLAIEGEAPLRLEPGDAAVAQEQTRALESSGAWLRVEGKTERGKTTDGRERWRLTFRLDPRKPGEVKLQPAALTFTEGPEHKMHRVEWQPMVLTIQTEIAQADMKELRELIGPEELPPVRRWWLPWLIGLGLLLAVAGLIVGGRELKRRLATPPPPPLPHEWALAELERIEKLNLPAAGRTEQFHTLLADVLRHYFELRFQLPALKQTSAEFLETVRTLPALGAEQREHLREFLRRCDLAKFAQADFSAEECRATVELARLLVRQTSVRPEGALS